MANPEQVDIKSWRMSGTPVGVWSGALAAATTTNPNGKKGSSSAEQQAMGPRHNSLLSESLFLGGNKPYSRQGWLLHPQRCHLTHPKGSRGCI